MNPATISEGLEVAAPAALRADPPPVVCVLDDDGVQVELLMELAESVGFRAVGATDPVEALAAVRAANCRVVLCDLRMPEMDGLRFLDRALQLDPGLFVVMVSGQYTIESAVEAIRRGAWDFLGKPVEPAHIRKILHEIRAKLEARRRTRALEEQLLGMLEFRGMIGRSPAMLDVLEMVQKMARHFSNILVSGSTGSGKELVARALHQLSPVGQQRFAVCNCSALVETLLESQLFGHMRGAFTGATETRAGLFEYAAGGTVFLDEIAETSPATQAKLLRVIENREIQRVGSPEVKLVDVRLIAATNRDLRAEVAAGRFREDLYYRLSTLQIRVPGLAERAEDIPLLTQFFLRRSNEAYGKNVRGLTRRAQVLLQRHAWPGNVRELENVVSSAALLACGEFIDVADLPEHLLKAVPPANNQAETCWRPLPLSEVKRQHIERTLQHCHGNRMRASELLGIGRTSLYRFLKSGGQELPE